MEWFLIIYLFSTDDVLISNYRTQKSCQHFSQKIKNIYTDKKDIKFVECVKGEFIDDIIVTHHGKTEENQNNNSE